MLTTGLVSTRRLPSHGVSRCRLLIGWKWSNGGNRETITSDKPDLGEVCEELEAEYGGDPIAIGSHPKHVVELLTQMTSDRVTLALGAELDPGLIRPFTGDDYLGVV